MLGMTSGADWLIAGLGNPEPKYDGTRHNAGFEALDYLAAQWHCDIAKAKWQGLYGTAQVEDHKVVLLKPLTYMNLSGQSIAPAANFYKIPADHVLVIYDDVSLPVGKLRVRPTGSAGGHNGIKNIIAHLGTPDFPRIKIGTGAPEHPDHDMIDWVIGVPSQGEKKLLAESFETAIQAAECILRDGCQKAMNQFN